MFSIIIYTFFYQVINFLDIRFSYVSNNFPALLALEIEATIFD